MIGRRRGRFGGVCIIETGDVRSERGKRLFHSRVATVEVVENPKDGIWIFAKYLNCPDDPSLEGTEDMFFAQDLVEVLA